ncbi:MAG: S26 family signal peptidase [Actinomycetota bacterium]
MAALAVGVGVAYSFVRWRPFRVEVSGPSMAPTLLPGDFALAVKPGRLRRGDVVVLEHPKRSGLEMVKRITGLPDELAPDGRILELDEWWVEGDNPDGSTDSRHFGPVRRDLIKAKVRLVYWPPSRRRLL